MFGNLSIRSKLIPLLAVPVAGSLLLGVAGVAGGFGERARAAEEARVAVVAAQAVAAAHELQEECVRAVAWLAGGGRGDLAELAARRRRVDRAVAAYRAGEAGLGRTGDPALDQALAAAATRLERLGVVRAETDRRLLTPELAGGGHDALVDALIGAARAWPPTWTPPHRPGPARLLLAVAAAKEATGRERTLLAALPPTPQISSTTRTPTTPQTPPPSRTPGVRDPNPPTPGPPNREGNPAAGGGGPAVHSPSPAAGAQAGTCAAKPAAGTVAGAPAAEPGANDEVLRVRLVAWAAVARGELNGLRAAAGDRLAEVDRAQDGPKIRDVRRLELALLDPVAGPALVGDLERWRDGLASRAGALRQVERAVAGDLAEGAAAWRVGRERRLRSWLLLAGAVLAASLAAAAAALRVRDGGPEPALTAGGTVLGLARRGQALADRQLQLLEGLTRDEPDPQRRRGLLGADNLAGRLRRTVETMLAVVGPEPVRERSRPLPSRRCSAPPSPRPSPAGRRGPHPAARGRPGRRQALPATRPRAHPTTRPRTHSDPDPRHGPAGSSASSTAMLRRPRSAPGPAWRPGSARCPGLGGGSTCSLPGTSRSPGPPPSTWSTSWPSCSTMRPRSRRPRRRSWSPGRPTATGTWSRSPTAASA